MNAYKEMHQAVLALSAWAKVVKNNPKDTTAIECAEFVEETIKTALAEPPRNCDVYNSETCRMAYHMKGLGLMTMQAFADWLFSPYEEGGEK